MYCPKTALLSIIITSPIFQCQAPLTLRITYLQAAMPSHSRACVPQFTNIIGLPIL